MDGVVLVAEDDAGVRKVLSQALVRAGCRVHATSLLTTLARWIDEGKGDLVITDVIMPDGNGLERVLEMKRSRPELPFIVISAQNTIATAIKAEEADAFAYLPKPFDVPSLLNHVRVALDSPPVRARTGSDSKSAKEEELPLVGRTPVMQSLYKVIAKVINSEVPLHIVGESGTGKSLVARVIHDLSDRRSYPFVTVGADRMEGPDQLATHLSRASGGTIVFDEVGDFGPDVQSTLVRGLDGASHPTPRVISTTQFQLAGKGSEASFRKDLFYRLCGIQIEVPPLRRRIDDIPLLASHFLQSTENGGRLSFGKAATDILKSYVWPGNVRQLRSIVQHLSLSAQRPEISDTDARAVIETLPDRRKLSSHNTNTILDEQVEEQIRHYFNLYGSGHPPAGVHLRVLREIEKPLIEAALDATGGNNIKCAEILGINRNTLRKKIRHLGITPRRSKRLA